MNHVVECSSIYDIDFTAILYDYIYLGQEDYTIFLNCSADVDTKYQREHISRLSIPLLCWGKDANNQLRQLHAPINSDLRQTGFLEALRNALTHYIHLGCNSESLADLYNEISEKTCHDMTSLECYMVLIETLIQRICGINVKVCDFSAIRQNGASEIKSFLRNTIDELSKTENGHYQFSKGGRIELLVNAFWVKINRFCVSNSRVVFYDEKMCRVDSDLLLRDESQVRLRGPLETVALNEFGTLIDLPWYLDANFSEEKANGLEFISPISVASEERVSSMFGGNCRRVCPSGYSLIEYYTPYVEKILKALLDEKDSVTLNDLEDWLALINNYPISNQKISKSLRSIKTYCDGLLQIKFNELMQNNLEIMKMNDYNYVNLGTILVNMCLVLRYYRHISIEKSPYYNSCSIKSYYNRKNIDEFYDDTIIVLNKTRKLFSRFYLECKELDDFIRLISSRDAFLNCAVSNSYDRSDSFYHLVSKLEKKANEIIRNYYSIALFVSGVILKANIFSLYCVIGNGKAVKCKIEEILEKRDTKYLKYKPIWYERINDGQSYTI